MPTFPNFFPAPREDENQNDFVARCVAAPQAKAAVSDPATRIDRCERRWEVARDDALGLTPTGRIAENAVVVNADTGGRDPTQTITLRRKYGAAIFNRFRELKGLVLQSLIENDALNTNQRADVPPGRAATSFGTSDDERVERFAEWFRRTIDRVVLEAVRGPQGEIRARNRWQDEFVRQAAAKGVRDAERRMARAGVEINEFSSFTSIFGNNRSLATHQDEDELERPGPISASPFGRTPAAIEDLRQKLQLLQERNFRELLGVSDAVAQAVERELAEGLSRGMNPRRVAAFINDRIDAIGVKRGRTIARTEIIRAHAETTLSRYEASGVEEVRGKAEFATAGDDRVCPRCFALEGETFTLEEARGVIPVHANCRCTWLPVTGALPGAPPEAETTPVVDPEQFFDPEQIPTREEVLAGIEGTGSAAGASTPFGVMNPHEADRTNDLMLSRLTDEEREKARIDVNAPSIGPKKVEDRVTGEAAKEVAILARDDAPTDELTALWNSVGDARGMSDDIEESVRFGVRISGPYNSVEEWAEGELPPAPRQRFLDLFDELQTVPRAESMRELVEIAEGADEIGMRIARGVKTDIAENIWRVASEAWQGGSDRGTLVQALQLAAREEFELENTTLGHLRIGPNARDLFDETGGALRALLRGQWQRTQNILEENNIETLTLYRGMKFGNVQPANRPDWYQGPMEPGTIGRLVDEGNFDEVVARVPDFRLGPMSSFSTAPTAAMKFTSALDDVVLSIRVPREAVLSLGSDGLGTIGEFEVVTLGTETPGLAFLRGAIRRRIDSMRRTGLLPDLTPGPDDHRLHQLAVGDILRKMDLLDPDVRIDIAAGRVLPRVDPAFDVGPAISTRLEEFERSRLDETTEHGLWLDGDGNVVVEHTDNDTDTITIRGSDLGDIRAEAEIMTHNHPKGGQGDIFIAPSPQDIDALDRLSSNIAEVRAVSDLGNFAGVKARYARYRVAWPDGIDTPRERRRLSRSVTDNMDLLREVVDRRPDSIADLLETTGLDEQIDEETFEELEEEADVEQQLGGLPEGSLRRLYNLAIQMWWADEYLNEIAEEEGLRWTVEFVN